MKGHIKIQGDNKSSSLLNLCESSLECYVHFLAETRMILAILRKKRETKMKLLGEFNVISAAINIANRSKKGY